MKAVSILALLVVMVCICITDSKDIWKPPPETTTEPPVTQHQRSDERKTRTAAIGHGDPHMMTFDAQEYDFEGYCSYVLVKDCLKKSFKIIADFRGQYAPNKPPTRMVAITITGEGIPEIRLLEDNTYSIGGQLHNNTRETVNIHRDWGFITVRGSRPTVNLTGLKLIVIWNGGTHRVRINLDNTDMHGHVCGLMGNADGNPDNDYIKPDGSIVYDVNEFGNSWAVPGSCP
ncbi:BMP-binding endothelial regulator protein-like [Saccoglossus kowalevskii]|uniref:IgGFc-binding protein-like n=1 Tax=Saccoglossus kowalevskii TaxID=10224 RepID=A0ABM0LUZ8_SACKO|nr:PREDICTED: IgGFc-binding protein-like [Saccoglossus kowalevskii]